MFNNEKNIFIQETEEKPNRYALFVLIVSFVGIVVCWILDEVGIFRADKTVMRIGSAVTLIIILIPLALLLSKKENLSNPGMKYIVISAAFAYTLATNTLLAFHTTLMLFYPIFIAMLYKSKSIGKIALVGSVSCAVVSPLLSYLLGIWDVPLFKELILISTGGDTTISQVEHSANMVDIIKILLYLVFPKLVVLIPCSILMFYVISIGSKQIENQIELNRLGHIDSMTGLYNKNYYNEISRDTSYQGPCGILYFDVNNLKETNDHGGHELGDLLLKRCAQSLIEITKDSDNMGAFRLGGDEFAIVVLEASETDISKLIVKWKETLARINEENKQLYDGLVCSVAYGCSVGTFAYIDTLLKEADAQMYINKASMRSNS